MIVVDTSVWIDHFRTNQAGLAALLDDAQVLVHPFIIGELACGNLRARAELLSLLQQLPHAPQASQEEVLLFIERHALMGRGIGYVDAHLLAATALAEEARLWTRDRRLKRVAEDLNISH